MDIALPVDHLFYIYLFGVKTQLLHTAHTAILCLACWKLPGKYKYRGFVAKNIHEDTTVACDGSLFTVDSGPWGRLAP